MSSSSSPIVLQPTLTATATQVMEDETRNPRPVGDPGLAKDANRGNPLLANDASSRLLDRSQGRATWTRGSGRSRSSVVAPILADLRACFVAKPVARRRSRWRTNAIVRDMRAVRAKGDSTRPVDMPGARSNHVSADVQRRVWAAAVGADRAGATAQGSGRLRSGAGILREDRRWIESFHDEPDAKRQLPEELWDCCEARPAGRLRVGPEQSGNRRSED